MYLRRADEPRRAATGLRCRVPWNRPTPVDLVIAAGVAALGVAEAGASDASVLSLCVGAALGVPAAARQRAPSFAVLGSVLLLGGVTWMNQGETTLAAAIALVLTVATAAAIQPLARSAPVLGALLGAVAVMVAIDGGPLDIGFATFLYGGAWTIGAELQRRRQQTHAALTEAAAQATEAEVGKTEAIQHERARIARELHDVVAHSLSIVTLHTQAVRRRLGPDEARDRAALQAAEDAARSALVELRRLVGLLRAEGDLPLEPQPDLSQIKALVAALQDAGVGTVVNVDPELRLPPGLDLTAYRIVQEATTNILKHSRARHATIEVLRASNALHITISDDGDGDDAKHANGSGHGLVGMRERVALYGGQFTAGPQNGGGFIVCARLPMVGA